MLQSLLQPRENQRFAVRHERRRNEKRSGGGGGGTGGGAGGGGGGGGGAGGRRPSQLPLQLGRPLDLDATPSPDPHHFRNELYVCGKVGLLHGIVGALLLGIVVLVVGLVQLSPGAEAAQHRFYLMGAGAALCTGGLLAAVLRCICLHWFNRKYGMNARRRAGGVAGGGGAGAGAGGGGGGAHKAAHGVSLLDAAHTHGTAAHAQSHRPRLKAQASVADPPAPAPVAT